MADNTNATKINDTTISKQSKNENERNKERASRSPKTNKNKRCGSSGSLELRAGNTLASHFRVGERAMYEYVVQANRAKPHVKSSLCCKFGAQILLLAVVSLAVLYASSRESHDAHSIRVCYGCLVLV